MLINKHHLRVHHAASKNSTRPVLQTIDIRSEGDQVVSVATDGYVLAEVRQDAMRADDEYPTSDSRPVDACRMSARTAKRILPLLPKKPVLPILMYAQVEDQGVRVTDLEHTQVFTDEQVDGKFPDYEKLLPAAEAAIASVKLNPEYLATILKVFKDQGSVTLELHGPLQPVVMRSDLEGGRITGVVMPVKA